jgi:hypothetical protein
MVESPLTTHPGCVRQIVIPAEAGAQPVRHPGEGRDLSTRKSRRIDETPAFAGVTGRA